MYSQYAVLDDGYHSTTGNPAPTILGPVLGTTTVGYTVGASFNSKAIDLRNVQQFGTVVSFLSGSTVAGSLFLQVCDTPEAPDNKASPSAAFANWITITAPVTTVTPITSGASDTAFDYPLAGHRWIRVGFTYVSGSGVVRIPYTIKLV